MPNKQMFEIEYQDGSSEGLLLTPVGFSLYRCEESSMMGEVVYGDVIEGEQNEGGPLRFVRVAIPSDMNTLSCILTSEQTNAPGLKSILAQIVELGGNWEQAFGGVLLVHLPKSVKLDVEAEIRSLRIGDPSSTAE